MSADGWKAYPAEINLHRNRSLFACRAKSEGRKSGGVAPADSSPLRNKTGNLASAHPDRVAPLTRATQGRFSESRGVIPALIEERREGQRGGSGSTFRGVISGVFRPVTMMDVDKAIAGLAGGKSPGTDGCPAEIRAWLAAII